MASDPRPGTFAAARITGGSVQQIGLFGARGVQQCPTMCNKSAQRVGCETVRSRKGQSLTQARRHGDEGRRKMRTGHRRIGRRVSLIWRVNGIRTENPPLLISRRHGDRRSRKCRGRETATQRVQHGPHIAPSCAFGTPIAESYRSHPRRSGDRVTTRVAMPIEIESQRRAR